MENNLPATVFIADDNPQNLNVLSAILEDAGYTVRASINGPELLEGIDIAPPDLIILDIHMPKMDGYEVCGLLKESEKYNDIPVIFCSALNEPYNIVKGFDLGGVDFISKPYRSEEVLARVRTHLSLQKRKLQLVDALESLKAAQQQLVQSEKLTSVGILAAGIAHQINNPVNYIVNSLQGFRIDFEDLLKLMNFYAENEKLQSPEFAEKAATIKAQIEYPKLIQEMQDLVEGIYTGSMKVHDFVTTLKSFTTETKGDRTPINITDEINRAVLMIEHRFDGSISLKKDVADLPEILGHPGTISQVILQLLQNGLDAIQTKEKLNGTEEVTLKARLAAENGNNQIEISIHDTGIGMQGKAPIHAFDPFFTTSPANRQNGLGLTTCYRIVTSMGGSLDFESLENTGTTVTVHLPVNR